LFRDAEIIYDHVILQQKDKKKENIENNDLAASQTEEISKGLNRYKVKYTILIYTSILF